MNRYVLSTIFAPTVFSLCSMENEANFDYPLFGDSAEILVDIDHGPLQRTPVPDSRNEFKLTGLNKDAIIRDTGISAEELEAAIKQYRKYAPMRPFPAHDYTKLKGLADKYEERMFRMKYYGKQHLAEKRADSRKRRNSARAQVVRLTETERQALIARAESEEVFNHAILAFKHWPKVGDKLTDLTREELQRYARSYESQLDRKHTH